MGLLMLRDELAKRLWKQSSTFRRLLTSRHVLDLQLIYIVTLLATIGLLAWLVFPPNSSSVFGELNGQSFGALLLVCGTILAWAYQTGSKRLGVVDLFACEIVTLCRVGNIVELVPLLIAAHEKLGGSNSAKGPDATGINFERFTSQENYFPVFQENTKDLQVLEADVVINVTAFYTYMKTLRDQLRRLGELGSGPGSKQQKSAVLVNAIYMTFLAYESARKSIEELIEFEPTQAEAMVTGLVSELRAYRFLTKCFGPEDIRGRRLALREDRYGDFVPMLYQKVMNSTSDDWENAQSTAVNLEHLYNDLGFAPKIAAISPRGSFAGFERPVPDGILGPSWR
jgi:hypothetical protein